MLGQVAVRSSYHLHALLGAARQASHAACCPVTWRHTSARRSSREFRLAAHICLCEGVLAWALGDRGRLVWTYASREGICHGDN
jgi:hypothetical protein